MVCLIQTKQLSFQKLAKVAQTKEQMDRSNRLACGYSIIRAADIHRFLGLSMLRQAIWWTWWVMHVIFQHVLIRARLDNT